MSFDPKSTPEDPFGKPPPPTVEAEFERPGVTPGTGLPRNIAAALACIFPLVGGVVFFVLDRRDRFVRFYALQSIVLGGVLCAISVVLNICTFILGSLPLIGWVFAKFFGFVAYAAFIGFVILWIPLIWNAYRGKTHEMPFLWAVAKRHIPGALL